MTRFLKRLLLPYDYIKRSFYRKLLLSFFSIITISISFIGLDYYHQMSSLIKQSAIINMERLSEQSVLNLETTMNHISQEVFNYFADSDFQSFVKSMQDDLGKNNHYYGKLSHFNGNNPIIDVIMVDDLQQTGLSIGRYRYYGNPEQIRFFENERQRMHDIAIQNNGRAAWVVSHVLQQEPRKFLNTVTFTQALKELKLTEQQTIGAFIIELSPDKLRNWLESVGSHNQGAFYVVDKQDGRIILSQDNSKLDTQIFDQAGLDELRKEREDRHFFVDHQGEKSLVVYEEIKNTGWLLVGKVPLQDLLKEINGMAKRTIVIGLISLLGSFVLVSFLSSMVIVSLKRLKRSMKHIESGNYNIAVPIETEDEIGYLCMSFNRMVRQINQLIVKVYETELSKKDAEIKALQSQINPHFLYNTLGTIDSLATGQDNRIAVISRSLAKMFRYSVDGGRMSTLEMEIQQLLLYLSIQKIRFESRLEFTIEVEPGLERMMIPKLLIQPIVENSIIHGIEHVPSGGWIRIQAVSVDERDAEIRVWDNGKGMNGERLKQVQALLETWPIVNQQLHSKGNSIGLMNVQSRIKLVYGNQYGMILQSESDAGTEVTIRLSKIGILEAGDRYESDGTG